MDDQGGWKWDIVVYPLEIDGKKNIFLLRKISKCLVIQSPMGTVDRTEKTDNFKAKNKVTAYS